MIKLQLFGAPSLWNGDIEIGLLCKKAWGIIGFVAACAERPVSRARIAGELWPELDDEHARQAMATTLWRLGKTLSPHGLTVDRLFLRKGEFLTIAADGLVCDSRDFRSLLGAPRLLGPRLLALGDSGKGQLCQTERFEAGTALHSAPFMEAIHDDWCVTERECLRVMQINALDQLLAHFELCSDYHSVLRLGRQLLSLEPYLEHVHRSVIVAFGNLGERASAARQFAICETMLRKELQVSPLPETVDAYCQAIGASGSGHPVVTDVQAERSRPKAPELIRRQALENIRNHLLEASKEIDNLDRLGISPRSLGS